MAVTFLILFLLRYFNDFPDDFGRFDWDLGLRLLYSLLRLFFDLFLFDYHLLFRLSFRFAHIVNSVLSEIAVPIMVSAVLVADEALNCKWVPLATPVMPATPGPVLADETDGAARTPIVISAPRSILALHFVRSLA